MELWEFPLQASSALGECRDPNPKMPLGHGSSLPAWLRTLGLPGLCLELLCSRGAQGPCDQPESWHAGLGNILRSSEIWHQVLREEDPRWFEPDRESQRSRAEALLGQRLVLQDRLCVTWAVMLCSVLSSPSTSRDKAPGGCQCSRCCSSGSCEWYRGAGRSWG